MTHLILSRTINNPDSFYAELINIHNGLSDEESATLNARLILLLANHIGQESILLEALAAAGQAK